MTFNTLKTLMGFFVTMINKYSPLKFEKNTLEGIYNYLKVNDNLCTSGQPSQGQFLLIRDAGYKTVINLLPMGGENALPDEEEIVLGLGMNYVYIPVDFKNPKKDDFDQFVNTLQESSNSMVWVHCAANMRVSAFVYRYRCMILKENEVLAKTDLGKIWQPFGNWKSFLYGASTDTDSI